MNYHVTGSIRLAHTKARMDEYAPCARHGPRAGAGVRAADRRPRSRSAIPSSSCTISRAALWDPFDGDIDPSQLTQALPRARATWAAEIERFTRVTGLERTKAGEWLREDRQGRHHLRDRGQRRRLSRRRDHGHGRAVHADRLHVASVSGDRAGRGTGRRARRSCRCCAIPIPATICGRSAAACCSGPMSGRRRPTGSTAFPRIRLSALSRRSGAAGDLHRRRHQARADPRHGRRAEGDQRADPLFARRQSLYRPGPRPAELLSNAAASASASRSRAAAARRVAEWIVHGEPEWDFWIFDPRRYTDYATKKYVVGEGDRALSERIRHRLSRRGASGRAAGEDHAAL